MDLFLLFWSGVLVILLALSLPTALRAKSWNRLFRSMILCAAGILFPVFVFLTSSFLVLLTDGKNSCRFGWLDCFHLGKLALTPLVLWASAAFYVREVVQPPPKPRPWVDLGLFVGAVTSTLCFIVGVLILPKNSDFSAFMLVPLYVALWYSVCFHHAIRASGLTLSAYVLTLVGSLPFWIAAMIWSKKHYMTLPDHSPGCFVVTAALRGHANIVGPFTEVERRGSTQIVNKQLTTFWRFEQCWSIRHPQTHRAFRKHYNHLGPRIAARIHNPFVADLVHLLLKPFELLASWLILLDRKWIAQSKAD